MRAGTGQPLLYLHDTFSYTWTRVHDALAAHYEVLFPIHPGCAGSGRLGRHRGHGRPGVSLSGCVCHAGATTPGPARPLAWGLARGGVGGALPGDAARSILVDAFGLRVPEAPATDLLRLDAAQMRPVLFADPHAAVAQDLIPDMPAPESLEARFRARQTLARFAWQFPDNPKLSRYLYRVKTPTLIIWGAQDGVVSTAHAQAYLRGIAGAELVILPRCGHLPLAEQPEACVHAVLHYLARLGS